MIRYLSFALILFLTGCDQATDSQAAAGTSVPATQSAEKAVADSGPTDCGTYFNEVRQACLDSWHRGLKLDCGKLFIEAQIVHDQAAGKGFGNPNTNTDGSEMGGAMCGTFIGKLRETRKKAEAESGLIDISWGPECTKFFQHLEDQCLAPLERGEIEEGCTTDIGIGLLKRTKPGEEGEFGCGMMNAMKG